MQDVHPGDVVALRYRIVAPLGHGGMGAVYRAEHLELGTQVALKIMEPVHATSPDALARFRREARAAAAVRSQHVVQILDFGVDGGTPYLVMELLEGETLRASLRRTGRLPLEHVLRVVEQIAAGVGKAHAVNVVHRDLKPENVFLARSDGGPEIVKVLDFGIAKVTASPHAADQLTRTGAALGTPQYMSPEQVEGRRAIDFRTDIWSLGVIAFECAAGRAPFVAESIGDLVLQICTKPMPVPSHVALLPRAFDAWFARAAHRDPAQRFASAAAMVDALREVVTSAAATPTIGTAATIAGAAGTPVEFKGGDARAGYVIGPNTATRTLHIRNWGLWHAALLEVYRADMLRALDLLDGAPWVALADATRFPPQRPEIAVVLGELRAEGSRRGCRRAASVVASAVAQMQIRRLIEDTGIEFRAFLTVDEAKAWLGR